MNDEVAVRIGNAIGGLKMENNDILIRLRYALDIKNTEMVEIFKLGGIEVTKEEVLKMLTKSNDSYMMKLTMENREMKRI